MNSVLNTTSDRLQWLEARKKCLGATDVASILGHGFGTPQTVWADKTSTAIDDKPPHPILQMGLALEMLNVKMYCDRLDLAIGEDVTKPVGISMHPRHSWLGATLDFQRVSGMPIETKYAAIFRGEKWGDELTDQVPNGYLIQCITQAECVGVDLADLSAMDGFGNHRIYRIGRDPKIVGLIIEVGHEFWERFVQAGTPPPDGWMHPATQAIAERLMAIEREKSVVLSDEFGEVAKQYAELGRIAKEAKEARDEAREKLLAAMGDCGKAVAGDYRLSKWINPELVVEAKSYTKAAHVAIRVTEIKSKKGPKE